LTGGGIIPGCEGMDANEACAISAAGCVGGCTGDAITKITSFLSCNEAGWFEFGCLGGDAKSSKCIESSGIDKDAYDECKADSSKIKEIQDGFNQAGSKIHSFPTIRIGGHQHSMAQDEASIKAALCKEGVTAACAGIVV